MPLRAKPSRQPGSSCNKPLVSVGLPVYNCASYLGDAVEAILQQTFTDFELIISDNASTDGTQAICEAFAARDKRVHYHRNAKNIGAAKNYNQLIDMAAGCYFRWAAGDDVMAPQCLQKCVDVLDEKPDVLLCHTATSLIDENGQFTGHAKDQLHLSAEQPSARLSQYYAAKLGMWNAVYGLMRVEPLRNSSRIGSYVSSDQVLLGELALHGKFHQIPEQLFSRRLHSAQAGGAYKVKRKATRDLAIWFNPDNKNKRQLPKQLQHFISYMGNVSRVKLPLHEKALCYFHTVSWAVDKFIWQRVLRLRNKVTRQLFDKPDMS